MENKDEQIRKELIYFIRKEKEYIESKVKPENSPKLMFLIDALAYLEKKKEPKLESCDCSRDEESYTNGIHHVLMNPEAYGLIKQKPAGWSEEDKKKLSAVLFSISRFGGEEHLKTKGYKYAEISNWLKSLRPQQKVELNDEDKRRFMSCLLRLRTNEGVDTINSRWFETRFASLCTQLNWKPSEEQMKALLSKLPVVKGSGDKVQDILESLYEDLKQL